MRIAGNLINIDALILSAENATFITSQLIEEDFVDGSTLVDELYYQLHSFGNNVLGRFGVVVAFGDHVLGNHNGTYTSLVDGRTHGFAGRYKGICSVFVEVPVGLSAGGETNVVPAVEFNITHLQLEGARPGNSLSREFSSVAVPLLGQKPQVYEWS